VAEGGAVTRSLTVERPLGSPGPGHRSDHTDLVVPVAAATAPVGSPIDAIIVPTARPSAYLKDTLRLGAELGAPVVALCSLRAGAAGAHAAARDLDVHLIATDVGGTAGLPAFHTSAMLDGSRLFRRPTDTSLKRNLGLALAVMVGWKRVVFIDDDITELRAADMRAAAGLLDSYDLVALANDGFPDNSVVCHALRATGVRQGSFVGGGALAVNVGVGASFFPNIYNEDWFFLVNGERLRRIAVTGRVVQKPFDPYDRPDRARNQEFGDCLAEGLFALFHTGAPEDARRRRFWRDFLADRRAIIEDIIVKVPGLDRSDAELGRMMAAMKASRARLSLISPEMCTNFIRAWQGDLLNWGKCLENLPSFEVNRVRRALAHLGLTSTQIARPR
jgi:hypothetical protein